ncbi:MAG: DUF2207 domain-containing protein [Clostridium sp.]|nr:DUF2207 domain-containing protein [Clostridium sp.]
MKDKTKGIKYFKKLIYTMLLILAFQVFMPNSIKALAVDYEVEKFDAVVNILENGDAEITEDITYYFDGDANGILRDIDYERTDGIKNVSVGIIEDDGSVRQFDEDFGAGFNIYEENDTGGILELKIYEKSYSENKTFRIKYTFENVVEKYNDIAIFNRKIIDSGWDVPLNDITIKIVLPEGSKKEDLRVFAHGPLTGTSEIYDDKTLLFDVPNVYGEFIETLVVFNRDIVPASTNIIDRDELDNILENEKVLAEEANQEREEAREEIAKMERKETLRERFKVFFIGLILAAGVMIIATIRKFTKERTPEFQGDYYRELPEDYSPAVMSYLVHKKKVSQDDVMATLLDLARKKVIKFEPMTIEKKGFFKKDIETFKISRVSGGENVSLLPHEKFLAEWFVDEMGRGGGLILSDLEELVKKRKFALQFQKDYDYFITLAKDEAESKDFFEKNDMRGSKIYGLIFLIIGLVGIVIGLYLNSFLAIVASVLSFLGLMIMMILRFMERYSENGIEDYSKWQAFKRFLLDFSNLKEAEVPSIIIWEHYLVYATSLGIAEKVLKDLPDIYSAEELNNPNLTYMYGYSSFSRFYIMNTVLASSLKNVQTTVTSSQIASSTSSSAGGFGGGFSGGSSGGGGGGGGGGAF